MANFDGLVSGPGAVYNLFKASRKLTEFQILSTNAKNVIKVVNATVPVHSKTVSVRKADFEHLISLLQE